MTPEEYQRIKDAEKEHLRKLNALKQAAHRLRRQKQINDALHRLTGGRRQVLDEHEQMMDRLALETARHEARLDLALDAVAETTGDLAALEEALQKDRARALIRRMKQAEAPPEPTAVKPGPTPAGPEKTPPLPEKTIGRMKP